MQWEWVDSCLVVVAVSAICPSGINTTIVHKNVLQSINEMKDIYHVHIPIGLLVAYLSLDRSTANPCTSGCSS